jgi:hypothetical protein
MDPVVMKLVDAAREFRTVLAQEGATEQRECARLLRNALARLYLAVAYLPRPGAPADHAVAVLRLLHEIAVWA